MFSRAALTCPSHIQIKQSKIPNAGLGAFATTVIPAHTIIGEYTGERLSEEQINVDDRYVFTIKDKKGKALYYISARNPRSRKNPSNWTRFVNSIRKGEKHKQNCEFFQYSKHIYLRTCIDIQANQELICNYGPDYDLDG
jgi:SET domain-containing protein